MKTKRTLVALLLSASISAFIGCATDFQPWEGGNAVIEGRGGTKKIVEGMEVWTNGTPPRKFRILGTIVDARGSGVIDRVSFESNLVGKARQVGGDALIRGAYWVVVQPVTECLIYALFDL